MIDHFADRSYKTMLGTAFYNRYEEQAQLKKLINTHKLLIVYGPRNVGKSELVRYFLNKKHDGDFIIIDSRKLRARNLEERTGAIITSRTLRDLAKKVMKTVLTQLSSHLGIADLVISLSIQIKEDLRRLNKKILLFVDEFHELPGYSKFNRYENALEDLRSTAGLLSKQDIDLPTKIVLTVSEGFAVSSMAKSMLEGYSTGWFLVEHLEEKYFRALFEEYTSRKKCELGAREIYALVGGSPGVLVDLCPLPPDEVVNERIVAWIEIVEQALSEARNELEQKGINLSPSDLIRDALTVMKKPIKPIRDTRLNILAEKLVIGNIVYPKSFNGGIHYIPQYPVYEVILENGVKQGVESLLDLDPNIIYKEALESVT